jgi:hypothetical protein
LVVVVVEVAQLQTEDPVAAVVLEVIVLLLDLLVVEQVLKVHYQ